MTAADRINLIADSWALGQSGRGSATSALELIDRLGSENDRAVWDEVLRVFSRIDHLEQGRAGRAAFHVYARSGLRLVFARIGWNAKAGESQDVAMLRARMVGALGQYGDAAVLTEAKRRFAVFLKDPASLSTDLREPVTHLVGRTADRATYDTLLELARKTTNTSERVRYYSWPPPARSIRRWPRIASELRFPTSCRRASLALCSFGVALPSIASSPGTLSAIISTRWRRSRGPRSATPSRPA